MKTHKLTSLILGVIILAGLTGCIEGDDQIENLGSIPEGWEERVYDVYQLGIKVGERKELEGGWTTIDGVRAKGMSVYAKQGKGEETVYINQTVYLNEKCAPLRTDITAFQLDKTTKSTTIFSDKKIVFEGTRDNKTTTTTIKAKKNTYEDGVLYTLISCLPLIESYEVRLSVFSSFIGVRFDASLNVVGIEKIKVGNRMVECYTLEIEGSQAAKPIKIYVRTTDHLMVKQIDENSRTMMVIQPEYL